MGVCNGVAVEAFVHCGSIQEPCGSEPQHRSYSMACAVAERRSSDEASGKRLSEEDWSEVVELPRWPMALMASRPSYAKRNDGAAGAPVGGSALQEGVVDDPGGVPSVPAASTWEVPSIPTKLPPHLPCTWRVSPFRPPASASLSARPPPERSSPLRPACPLRPSSILSLPHGCPCPVLKLTVPCWTPFTFGIGRCRQEAIDSLKIYREPQAMMKRLDAARERLLDPRPALPPGEGEGDASRAGGDKSGGDWGAHSPLSPSPGPLVMLLSQDKSPGTSGGSEGQGVAVSPQRLTPEARYSAVVDSRGSSPGGSHSRPGTPTPVASEYSPEGLAGCDSPSRRQPQMGADDGEEGEGETMPPFSPLSRMPEMVSPPAEQEGEDEAEASGLKLGLLGWSQLPTAGEGRMSLRRLRVAVGGWAVTPGPWNIAESCGSRQLGPGGKEPISRGRTRSLWAWQCSTAGQGSLRVASVSASCRVFVLRTLFPDTAVW